MYNFDFEENSKWQKALDLTHAVWKVVDVSLESNLLKNKIKDLSSDILTKYTAYISENNYDESMTKSIDSLIALLSLAQKTSNIREINFLILKNEYKKIKFYISSKLEISQISQIGDESKREVIEKDVKTKIDKIKKSHDSPHQEKSSANTNKNNYPKTFKFENSKPNTKINERQEVIINFFKEGKNEKIRLKDVKKLFPNYTDRTIRNDLKGLCNMGVVLRSNGKGQGSFYYLPQ